MDEIKKLLNELCELFGEEQALEIVKRLLMGQAEQAR